MERFPRGTLPPSAFRAVTKRLATTQEITVQRTEAACDLTVTCPTCMIEMHPEHAHYKCPSCGYRDSCCF